MVFARRQSRRRDSTGLHTLPPVRLRMICADMLCPRSMEVEWENGTGMRQHWSSWQDELCGWYEAEKLLPASATDISVCFKVRTLSTAVGAVPAEMFKVDRHQGHCWIKDDITGKRIPEVIWFRHAGTSQTPPRAIDAAFELCGVGPSCYMSRAWDAGRGETEAPEPWEYWHKKSTRPKAAPLPDTLRAADEACEQILQGRDPHAATTRVAAAANVLQDIRRETLTKLRQINGELTTQWALVNSTNTLSAGLGVAAAVTLFIVPPVGIGLGIGSAAVGGSAQAGDTITDRLQIKDIKQQISRLIWNTLVVAELENEWLQALHADGVAISASAPISETAQVEDVGVDVTRGAQIGATVAGAGLARVVQGTEAAAGITTASTIMRGTTTVLGVTGALMSTGIAVHGWSTTKSLQVSVRSKIEVLESSILYTQRWLAGVGGLECPVCLESLELHSQVMRCHTWHYVHSHCFDQWARGHHQSCPVCRGPVNANERSQALQDLLAGDVRMYLEGVTA